MLVSLTSGYDARHLGDGPEEFQSVLRAGAYGVGLLIATSYATRREVSRLLVFVGVPTS